MNSIIHGFKSIDNGIIDINIEMQNEAKVAVNWVWVYIQPGNSGANGSISIVSEEGHGVEFKIIFPVKKTEARNMTRDAFM
jgi:two-component sensor histidine kinase